MKNAVQTIVYVSDAGEFGGAEAYLAVLAREFSGRYRVIVWCDRRVSSHFGTARLGPKVEVIARDSRRSIANAVHFLRLIGRDGVQFVHFNLTHYRSCLWLRILTWMYGARIIATLHTLSAPFKTWNPIKMMAQEFVMPWASSTIQKVIVPSRHLRQRMLDERSWNPSSIVVIPNGLKLPRVLDRKSSLRSELGLSHDAFLVGIVGRLNRYKGHKVALHAIADARNRGQAIYCAIIGEGEYREEIASEIERLGLKGNAFLLGFRPEPLEAIAECSAVVVPSIPPTGENYPTVILEAMALGVPVIASRIGGIPEQIEDGVNGLLFEPGDASQLHQRLTALLQDAGLRSKLAQAGKERFFQDIQYEAMIAGVDQVYRNEP